jgi:asparagine N-glycosylation enzyme membrane subunit Stt3
MLPNIKKFVKSADWRIAVVLLLAVCFFIGTSSYNYFGFTPLDNNNLMGQKDNFIKWSSPDEAANYFFAKLYVEKGELSFFEEYNLNAGDIVHPRSMRSDSGVVKPASFLGIILIFGFIAKLTSIKVLPYLTPLCGAVGIIFFYLLVKKIFNKKNAFISAFLLASFPPFIYYSVRSMFHNILFMVLLIVGLYFIISALLSKTLENAKERQMTPKNAKIDWREFLYPALGGGFIGLAIITRTSELIWILPMLFIIWIFNVRKIGFVKLIIFLSFLFLSILPMFYWNNILYGSPLSMGYGNAENTPLQKGGGGVIAVDMESARETVDAVADIPYYQEVFEKIKNGVSLFGFNPKQSLKMLYYYFTKMFPWLFWGAFLGFLLYLKRIKKWKKKEQIYFLAYFIISLILIFYYGSWEIHDNPDPKSFTIGNSYTRYWLPIYLGAMPLLSALILKLTKFITPFRKGGRGAIKSASRVIIVAAIFIISIQFVLAGSEEGLIASLNKCKETKYQYNKVLELTEESSVIITKYHDKLFFPERKVIVGLFDNKEMNERYAKLVDHALVYYYNFTLPPRDIDYLNNKRLKEVGLSIKEVENITGDFSLYRLYNSK